MVAIISLSLAVIVLSACIVYIVHDLVVLRRKLTKTVELFDKCTKELALRVDVLNNRCDSLSIVKHYDDLSKLSNPTSYDEYLGNV